MREQDLVRPVAEETVRHDDDSVARSEERVSDRLQGGMTRSRDREHVRIWGGPDVPHHLPGSEWAFTQAAALCGARGLARSSRHWPGRRAGPGMESRPGLQG